MRFLSLCSGIDAASVAWNPLGWQAVALSEIDAFPSAVLAHHYPSVPNFGDMTRFQEWPDDAACDVLIGGTPCQSFSVAGLRGGLDDPRGNLMLTFAAVARRYSPTWVVWENVPGVLSSNGGRDFAAFLSLMGECGYHGAWRVLDAQYFGLAQRRKRVFAIFHSGNWRRAASVLFERESMRGHPAPSREAGQSVAATLTRGAESSGRGGYAGRRREDDVNIVPSITGALNGSGGHAYPGQTLQDASVGLLIPERARALTTSNQRIDAETETLLVTHALRADGFDASEDGTGRGTPLVPVALFDERNVTSPHNRSACRPDDAVPTLHTDPLTIAFGWQNSARQGASASVTPTLDKSKVPGIGHGMHVRRLTPEECEALQGFPRGYTLIDYRGKPAADGPRYKALGNSMAVPVIRWIGERIALLHSRLAA